MLFVLAAAQALAGPQGSGPAVASGPLGSDTACPLPPAPARTRRAMVAARRVLREEQRQCIAAAVARFAPRVAGEANVFFVGFAGYGEQQVFSKEAQLARQVFGERFGSLDRSSWSTTCGTARATRSLLSRIFATPCASLAGAWTPSGTCWCSCSPRTA